MSAGLNGFRVRDFIRVQNPHERRMAVVRECAGLHGVAAHLVMGPSREADVCRARWAAMAAMRDRFGDSVIKIGRFFDRDHSTVVHGLQRHAELEARI